MQQLLNQQAQAINNGLPFLFQHPYLAMWFTFFWYILIAVCAVATVVLLWRIDKHFAGTSRLRTSRPVHWEQPERAEPSVAEAAPDNDDRYRPQG